MLGLKTSYSASAAAIELSIRTIFDKQDNISSTRLKEQWSETHIENRPIKNHYSSKLTNQRIGYRFGT